MTSSFEIIRKTFEIFFKRENLDYFVKVGLVSLCLNIVFLIPTYMEMFGMKVQDNDIESLLSNPAALIFTIVFTLIMMVIAIWAQASNYESVKRVLSDQDLSFKLTFKSSWKYLFRYFLAGLVVSFIIFGGLVLLIIPGIIFGTFYMFTTYSVVSGKRLRDSLRYSRALVKGRFWKVFWTTFGFGIFSFVVGIIFSLIPYSLGSLVLALFSGLFILPYFIFYKELEATLEKN